MKKFFKDEETKKKVFALAIAGCIIVLFYFLCKNIAGVGAFFSKLFSVLSPFIWGGLFALITYKLANKLEKVLPKKWSFKLKRILSSIVCILIIIIVIAIFVLIIVPQLTISIKELSTTIEYYTNHINEWVVQLSNKFKFPTELKEKLYSYSSDIITNIWKYVVESFPTIVDATKSTITFIMNFFIGFFICVYILMDREKLAEQFKKLFKAILSEKVYENFVKVTNLAFEKFSKFFLGKLIDSILVGVLCFIIMSICKMKYAALISCIVGISNIIPFFGPLFGGIIGGIIMLVADPKNTIWLILIVLVLQQVDGNIFEPLILGDIVGLSSLWVMFAVIVGGGFFGFLGMILGIPIFSIIYFLIEEWVKEKNDEGKVKVT